MYAIYPVVFDLLLYESSPGQNNSYKCILDGPKDKVMKEGLLTDVRSRMKELIQQL